MNSTFSVSAVALLALAPVLAGSPSYANDVLVAKHAAAHGVPESLVRRVIHIESKGNPLVVSKGNYGLMQIRLGTARAMGYRGDAQGLLDADTNMTYAVRYLAGAYRAARGNSEQAIRNYQRGYYYTARAQGFSPYTVASAAPAIQLPSAPDPTMLPQDVRREAIQQQQQQAVQQQQQAIQQQAIQQQSIQQAAQQERVAQRQAIEQQRSMQRQAALQAQVEQRQAAEQARIAQHQERIARQQAVQQERMAKQQAVEQQRVAQRQAMLQQRIDREQVREQQRVEREQARVQQRVEQQARAQAVPSAQSRRRVEAAQSYSWYNPMRYFKHPAHQANPYRP